jgi:hypothetical protein
MSNAPAGGGKVDPQAAISKYSAITNADPGQSQDAQVIHRVEAQLQGGGLLGWLRGMMGEVDARAASEKGQVDGKVAEQKQLVAQNSKDAPKDAGNPPAPGPAAHPAVPHPSSAGGDHGPAKAPAAVAKGGADVGHDHKVPAHPSPAGAKAAAAAEPAHAPLAAQLAAAPGDPQIDAILNGYTPKGQQSTQMLSRIKQMGDVAQGFNGQIDVYIAQGGAVEHAVAGVSNFLGVGKDVSAIWANNPYAKVHGLLGTLMQCLSGLKSIASVVGSICGKLGLVLTVVGLLGMIFPPIGAAVSGVARILNVVGLICDAISLVVSGILTGLNGVVLANQIKAGASAEEKAATADLMISEANEAAAGFVNLAMVFGPKFMKGLLGSSKGIIGSLLRRAKATIGKITLKISGDVKHFANKVVRKLGFGGAGAERIGGAWKDTGLVARTKEWAASTKLGKAFNSAPKVLEGVQEKLMDRYAEGLKSGKGWAKAINKAERVGLASGAIAHKWDIEEKVGAWGEKSGKFVGNLGADTKLGKNLAKAADEAERSTREAMMKQEMRDAVHLEEQRWKGQLDRRQAANPDHLRNKEAEHEFIAEQKEQVKEKFLADHEKHEAQREAKERLGELKEKRFERKNEELLDGANRDEYMQRLNESRIRRAEEEAAHKTQLDERKSLMAKAQRSAAEEEQLKALDRDLAGVDQARHVNDMRERELRSLASGGKASPEEITNWKDVGARVKEAAAPLLEALHIKNEGAWWEAAEKYNFKKPLQWDKKGAKKDAASRAGQGTFEDILTDSRRGREEEFSAFVRGSVRKSSVGATARSMLGGIGAAPAPAPTAAAASATATTTAAAPVAAVTPAAASSAAPAVAAPAATAAPTGATDTATPADSAQLTAAATAQAQQTHEPPAPAAAAAPVQEPADEGGSQALPYWPSLVPEFDKALHDFGYMRKVAVEFKKGQIEGKQKAVDTLAIYGRYHEYAKLRADAAAKNQQAAHDTKADTQHNVDHAGQSAQQAQTGEAKQGEARGQATNHAAVDLPEPESRGFWDRILGQVKRWAKNKAAQIFGWIQEKVGSVILKGLCGVSMGDLKAYASALRHQQQAAGGVADTAGKQSGQAQQQSIKLGADASKEAQSAADAIAECDHNIVEADQFMADLVSFEAQLNEEKAHAQAFIAQIHATAHAEQAKRRHEQELQEQEAAKHQQLASPVAGVVDPQPQPQPTATPTPDPIAGVSGPVDAAPAADDAPNPEAEAQAGQLQAAASYVATAGDQLVTQLDTKAEDYRNQLAVAMTNHNGKSADGTVLARNSYYLTDPAKKNSEKVVEELKEVVKHTKDDLAGFHDLAPQIQANPSSAQQIADTIIKAAEHLDHAFEEAQHALDELFERTYAGIRDGQRTLKSRILDGDNPIGHVNNAPPFS